MILFCLSRILEFANCTTSWFHISNSISIFSNFIPFLFLSFRVVHKNCLSLLICVAWKSRRCNIRKHFVFWKRDKGWKEERGSNHKVLGKKGQRFWRKNGHEFSSNGYRALPFSFRPSPVWFARAISTSGLSQFLRGSRYLQRRAFRADTECNSGIYPGQCVCVSRVTRK